MGALAQRWCGSRGASVAAPAGAPAAELVTAAEVENVFQVGVVSKHVLVLLCDGCDQGGRLQLAAEARHAAVHPSSEPCPLTGGCSLHIIGALPVFLHHELGGHSRWRGAAAARREAAVRTVRTAVRTKLILQSARRSILQKSTQCAECREADHAWGGVESSSGGGERMCIPSPEWATACPSLT